MKTLEDFYKENPEFRRQTWMWKIEGYFVLIVPIWLWGWKIGILVYSGLSSLLHICLLLKEVVARLPKKNG